MATDLPLPEGIEPMSPGACAWDVVGDFPDWLAEHDRATRADAWDAGWNVGYDERGWSTDDREYQLTENPYRDTGTGL